MKKLFLLSVILVLSWSAVAFSQPAIFDTGDSSLTLTCMRIKQNGQISDTCYKVRLVLDGNSFAISTISDPYTQAFENTDQVFDFDTFKVDIPYVSIGSDAYAVVLTFNVKDNHCYISSFGSSTVNNPHNTGSSIGSCNLTSITGMMGTGACIDYHNGDASAAKAGCDAVGGVWDPNGSCPANYLAVCSMPGNGYTSEEYYYDTGIVAMLDSARSVSPDVPTAVEMLDESCVGGGGTPIH